MHSDFVILGPNGDPAKIMGLKSTMDAFELIAKKRSVFFRGAMIPAQMQKSWTFGTTV
jgi:ABC-type tungstate transport system permease subunit